MPRATHLDKQWEELMFLCAKEAAFRREGTHPKVLRLVTGHIERLAAEMGFSENQIARREFRAERAGAHIVRIATDR